MSLHPGEILIRPVVSEKSRGTGGKATPPPANCGARIVPWRARPVPFWRHGFERPPATRPRLLAARVPWRRAFSSARTASCTTCGLISAPKTASSSETSFFAPPSTGALGAAITSDPPGDGFASLVCETQAAQGRREHSQQ